MQPKGGNPHHFLGKQKSCFEESKLKKAGNFISIQTVWSWVFVVFWLHLKPLILWLQLRLCLGFDWPSRIRTCLPKGSCRLGCMYSQPAYFIVVFCNEVVFKSKQKPFLFSFSNILHIWSIICPPRIVDWNKVFLLVNFLMVKVWTKLFSSEKKFLKIDDQWKTDRTLKGENDWNHF